VIRAILDNAIRFSPLEETITITVARPNGQCLFSVTDHGVGIEPAFLPHVFDEFVSTDVNYHAKGHGLSLAIARHIVAAHRGTIDADSIKGVGTTFTVKLPVAGG